MVGGYDDMRSWSSYLQWLEIVVAAARWADHAKAVQLASALEEPALQVVFGSSCQSYVTWHNLTASLGVTSNSFICKDLQILIKSNKLTFLFISRVNSECTLRVFYQILENAYKKLVYTVLNYFSQIYIMINRLICVIY